MLGKFYLATTVLLIGFYGYVAFTGSEFSDEQRQVVPADVRQSPGGYRSYHFWHSGYRGGK